MLRILPFALLACAASLLPLEVTGAEPPNPRALTWTEFIDLPTDSPIIIDNDSFFDVPGHYYLFGLASAGKADLRGIVVTPATDAMVDQTRLDAQMRDFRERVEIARKAGMTGIPDPVPGSFEADYERPGSLVIEDTRLLRKSAGSELIAREARAAGAAGKTLIVAVGGHSATVASAYLSDPGIADHVIVVAIGLDSANGLHEWASWIISKRMKLAHYSTHNRFPNHDPNRRTPGEWWPQLAEELMPQAKIDAVPNPIMRDELQRLKDRWNMVFKQNPSFVIEGYGDSEGYWVLHAKSVYKAHELSRARWVRDGHYVLYDHETDAARADALQMSLDHAAAINAFFALLQDPKTYRK
jgi:hypothetical protein